MINQGKWPVGWRLHWIHPIFKRKSRAAPENYRGVHLTSQLSKVCERVIISILRPWLDFGSNQFAYTPERGHRDALLFNLMQWLLWLEDGKQIGLYCSDVSGAFDKVCRARLCRKLKLLKMPKKLFLLIASWLDERSAQVVVDGICSIPISLKDSVFQGTVLGPPLWNTYFADATRATRSHGYLETVYADDMNVFKAFSRSCSHKDIMDDLERSRISLHK